MTKPRAWLSADPGQKGALCVLREDGKVLFFDTTEKPMDILNWLKALQAECDIQVMMVENVHAIHGSSAGASFKFGFNAAIVEILPLAAGISVDKVNPKEWQKKVGVRSTVKGKDLKKEVASICDRLYPEVSIRGPKGGLHDGKSDALMIAHFAKLKYR